MKKKNTLYMIANDCEVQSGVLLYCYTLWHCMLDFKGTNNNRKR